MQIDMKKTGEYGVSEALGFMLIFGMVIVGIGLVTLYGYPILIQQQTSADEQIMEKNMIVLQNDVKSITYKTVPYKETSLKIGGGTLYSNNPLSDATAPTFTIWDDTTGSGDPWVEDYRGGDLRYESLSAEADISLQNGAVVTRKHTEPGSSMLSEPRWFYDNATNTMVVSLIALNNTDTLSRAGIGTVQMKMETFPEKVTVTNPLMGGTNLFVMYDPGTSVQDYKEAWENYFANSLKATKIVCPIGGAEAICYEFPTDDSREVNLIIKKYEVNIKSL